MLPMTPAAPAARVFKAFDQHRARWVKQVTKLAVARLRASYRAVAAAIRETDGSQTEVNIAADTVLIADQANWLKFYLRVYTTVGLDFASEVATGLEAILGKGAPLPAETKAESVTVAEWRATITQYVEENSSTKITKITETTRTKIQGSLADGFAAGADPYALASSVAAQGGFQVGRGSVIARTETIGASNLGSHTAAASFQVPTIKRWLTTIDTRERPDHADANGQERELDDPYEVGGSLLLFPGDSSFSAAAKQIIQCRCVSLYAPKK